MTESCRPGRRVVARGPVCTIEECSCGILHLTIGVFTIRLEPSVVASVGQTIGEALRRLAEVRDPLAALERPS
jgi:hypothetical protein